MSRFSPDAKFQSRIDLRLTREDRQALDELMVSMACDTAAQVVRTLIRQAHRASKGDR